MEKDAMRRIRNHEIGQPSDGVLNDLFPDGVAAEVAAPWMWDAELTQEEEAIIRNAVGRRRHEFTAGRTCARSILKRFGFSGGLTIGKDRNGAPVWPEGIVGSISHTADVCVVCLGWRKPELTSLGLDVEQDVGLDPALMNLVCDEAEIEMCCHSGSGDPYRLAKVIFSAKESVYKCLYALTKTVLDFHDVHVELNVSERRFLGATTGSHHDGTVERVCNGSVFHDAGYIYTACSLPFPDKASHRNTGSCQCPVS